ncbi:outer membrane lipoprotein chaperone LolA [Wenzhouxiangella limi]|uniref:Outer-membrane lipoprotein carrier protein n=1 Tax=Wenzhouxiangella limi TaxID=2707351 RepID=A0A845VBJ2_9GAMM|nr:outer membrane lipoprotein chaperone LolA [Wenzhouxiangella limi]NDY94669.1 outer membrane lipoprotein chaperone LolA [Wenzhouxiangella limi]
MRWMICALLFLPGLVLADAKDELDRFADGLDTLSGSFRQIIFDDDGFALEESEGRLYYQAPDRFRWDYSDPFPQQLVADGQRLWHFDESLEQVTVRDQPAAGESALLVLTRPEMLERFYRIEPTESADELHFVPLDDESGFERASLRFVDGVPVTLEFTDRLVGQMTLVELRALERNPDLDDDLFRFEPPPGVDVLEGY